MLVLATAGAQTKRVVLYHDKYARNISQVYYVRLSKPDVPHGDFESYYENGSPKAKGRYADGQPQGHWQHFFENACLHSQGSYLSGQQHGFWIYYFENGSIKQQGYFEHGQRSKHWQYFSEEGYLKAEGKLLDSQPDSLWRYYHPDGGLKATCNYRKGAGFYREFHPDGLAKMQGLLRNGLSDSTWSYYFANGNLKAKGEEKQGVKHGYWYFFHENGKPHSEGSYENGQQTGEWIYYHPNGAVASKGSHQAGKKTGEWNFYHDSGQFQGQAMLVDGNGTYQELYPAGKLKVKGFIKDGNYDGDWSYYFDDGTLEGRCSYAAGTGEYFGYYKDGGLRITGTLVNGERKGTWLIYNRDGSLFGMYRSIDAGLDMIIKNGLGVDTASTRGTQGKMEVALPKNKLIKKQRLLIAVNPASAFFSQAYGFAEYFVEGKYGLSLGGIFRRNPMLGSHNLNTLNREYEEGYSFLVMGRRYFKDRGSGSLFLGTELRYTQRRYRINSLLLGSQATDATLQSGTEETSDLTGIAGTRLLLDLFKRHHLFIDIYGGLGLGLRNSNFPSPNAFNNARPSGLYIPLRAGISVGWYF